MLSKSSTATFCGALYEGLNGRLRFYNHHSPRKKIACIITVHPTCTVALSVATELSGCTCRHPVIHSKANSSVAVNGDDFRRWQLNPSSGRYYAKSSQTTLNFQANSDNLKMQAICYLWHDEESKEKTVLS